MSYTDLEKGLLGQLAFLGSEWNPSQNMGTALWGCVTHNSVLQTFLYPHVKGSPSPFLFKWNGKATEAFHASAGFYPFHFCDSRSGYTTHLPVFCWAVCKFKHPISSQSMILSLFYLFRTFIRLTFSFSKETL